MPKHYHSLNKSAIFLRLREKGAKVHNPHFTMVCYNRRDDQHPGLGIVASKRVMKLAVDRNLAKRRVRALINKLSPLGILNGLDILMIVRPGFIVEDFASLQKDLHKKIVYLRKAKLA